VELDDQIAATDRKILMDNDLSLNCLWNWMIQLPPLTAKFHWIDINH
jgi:hypothetical protein